MAYTPKEWHNGDTLYAEDLNNLEEMIAHIINEMLDPPSDGKTYVLQGKYVGTGTLKEKYLQWVPVN